MRYQVCRPLTPIEFAALKASIAESGVLVPIEVDEKGEILDGHHRVRAWQELRDEGVDVPQWAKLIRSGLTEEQKRNHARKLNLLRRQMSEDERETLAFAMAKDHASLRQIGEALGISHTEVKRTLDHPTVTNVPVDELPQTVIGKDGKKRSRKKARKAKLQTLFDPGESAALDLKAAAQTVKEEKEKKKAARKANQETYRQNGYVSPQPLDCGVIIHNKNARGLAELTADVHLVVTSPPYDVGIAYDSYDDNNPDHLPMIKEVWRECFKVMVDGARIAVVVPFGTWRDPYVAFDCQVMQTLTDAGFVLSGRIIWDKSTTGNRTSWGSFRYPSAPSLRDTCECIIIAHKGTGVLEIPPEVTLHDDKGKHTAWLSDSNYFMELAQDHWVVAPESAVRVGHPAPFPTELVRRLIHFYGYPGCHVLDPFAGSGTVGVVAKELGCQATLFELSQEYCRLAEERINGQVG